MADPFFNAAYYLAGNPDVATAGYTLATAEQHYDRYGAAEGRTPNIWFNAAAYLAAYPDLASHGVTAATAFQHYITYGINEGRGPAANVNPANFSYADYATANPDLKTAFGITDPAHLTADQQHQLFGHFLSFGYLENRPGIVSTDGNSFFVQFDHTPVQSAPPAPPVSMNIAVDGSHLNGIYTGGGADDVFTGTATNVSGTTLNGAGGNDTLNINVNLGAPSPTSVAVNSIEKINVDYGINPLGLLNVATAGTPSLSIELRGGVIGIQSSLAVISGDAALHTITVDGSREIGNLVFDLTSSTLVGADATLTGGAGDDTFGTAGFVGHIATLDGGAGNDTLFGSIGQDIMTGGTGNDNFRFGSGQAGPIDVGTATVDTITDFNVGDTLVFIALGSVTSTLGVVGTNLTSAIAFIESNNGVNQNLLFDTPDGTHYFLNTGNSIAPAAVIKIVLAAGLDWNDMVATTGGAHYVLPV